MSAGDEEELAALCAAEGESLEGAKVTIFTGPIRVDFAVPVDIVSREEDGKPPQQSDFQIDLVASLAGFMRDNGRPIEHIDGGLGYDAMMREALDHAFPVLAQVDTATVTPEILDAALRQELQPWMQSEWAAAHAKPAPRQGGTVVTLHKKPHAPHSKR